MDHSEAQTYKEGCSILPNQIIRKIPGPKFLLLLPRLFSIRRRIHRFLLEMTEVYGPVVRFPLGGRYVILLNDPTAIQYVLKEAPERFLKSRNYDRLRPLLGDGLLTSEKDTWRRQRKMIQPLFHRRALERFSNDMIRATERLLRDWQKQTPGHKLDLHEEMMRLTLAIVGLTLFSKDVLQDAKSVGQALGVALKVANQKVLAFFNLPGHWPTPRNRREQKAIRILDGIVGEMIRERRQGQRQEEDLLQLLLHASEEISGSRMSDQQVRDECMTIFLAGHETTANALSWAFYLLAQHPSVYQRMQNEVDTVLQGQLPTLDQLPELRYTTAVIEETLRLYPPAWTVERRNIETENICGFTIPKDTDVIMSPFVMHRLEKFWPQPDQFDPERFLGGKDSVRHPFVYFPFGGGQRVCIGKAFAMMEAQIILAMVTQKFTLSVQAGCSSIQEQALVTLRPKHGIPVELHPRT